MSCLRNILNMISDKEQVVVFDGNNKEIYRGVCENAEMKIKAENEFSEVRCIESRTTNTKGDSAIIISLEFPDDKELDLNLTDREYLLINYTLASFLNVNMFAKNEDGGKANTIDDISTLLGHLQSQFIDKAIEASESIKISWQDFNLIMLALLEMLNMWQIEGYRKMYRDTYGELRRLHAKLFDCQKKEEQR